MIETFVSPQNIYKFKDCFNEPRQHIRVQYHILKGSYLVILNNRLCFDIILAVYVFVNGFHSAADVAPFTVTLAHSCGQSRAMHPDVNLGLKLNVLAAQ